MRRKISANRNTSKLPMEKDGSAALLARKAAPLPGSIPIGATDGSTNAQKIAFLKEFRQAYNLTNALRKGRFDRKEFKRLMKKDADFSAAFRAIDREWLDKVEDKAYQAAAAGDQATARLILQSRFRKRYGDNHRIDVKLEDITRMSDEDLEELVKKCEVKGINGK